MDLKSKIKQSIPEGVWQPVSRTRYAVQRGLQYPGALLHPWRIKSMRGLAHFHNLHQGERCFIIGNGPSLKQTDLTRLKNEKTFGMNRIYMLFDELGFTTTYYVSVNSLVIEQCADDIRRISIPKFLSWRSHKLIRPTEDTYFLHTTYTGPKFARDVRFRLWEGATVTYVALQLAYYMGFGQVILIGVDHNFQSKGKPNTTVISEGDDPNHFDPRYFGKGFRWQLPDLETSEVAYSMARAVFEADGRHILDATIGGKLTIFPKIDYAALF